MSRAMPHEEMIAKLQRVSDRLKYLPASDLRGELADVLAALSTPAAPAPADLVTHDPPMGFCQWLDEGGDYTTECGHGWQFMDGGIEQNDAKFCLFCGGRITVVPLPEVPK